MQLVDGVARPVKYDRGIRFRHNVRRIEHFRALQNAEYRTQPCACHCKNDNDARNKKYLGD